MKMCRLKQTVAVLVLFLATSCGNPSGIPSLPETPLSSPHPTASGSIAREQATQLAFVSDRRQRGNLDIWLFDLTTKRMEPLTSDDWQDAKPVWSPDGQTLAFLSFEVGGPSVIRVVSLSDRKIHTLVPYKQYVPVTDFIWSGDGTSIFYTVFDGQTFESQVWQVDVQTGDRQHITNADSPISVSPNDQYLGVSIRKPEWRNYAVFRVFRLSDKTELQPIEEHFHPSGQAWAPQGDTLAVASETAPPQLGHIATYEVRGEDVNQQAVNFVPTEPRMSLCDLTWSRDGRRILVVRALTVANVCQGEVLLYDADLTRYQVLPLDGLAGYARWSEDGNWIAYSKDDTLHVYQYSLGVQKQASGEIWVAESTGLNASPLITGPAYNGQPAWRP
jgi:Tol biopolymer transport system component